MPTAWNLHKIHVMSDQVICFYCNRFDHVLEFIKLPTPGSLCVYLLLSVCFKFAIYAERGRRLMPGTNLILTNKELEMWWFVDSFFPPKLLAQV